MKKRLCFILIFALCVSLLSVGASAADIEDWEDVNPPTTSGSWTAIDEATGKPNYDVSWYNTTDNSFTLSDAADLAGLAVIVNDGLDGQKDKFAGKTVTLDKNVTFDLSAHTWTPIIEFEGAFDGNNATIYGMVIDSTSNAGLFSQITSTAIVKNVNITNAYIVVQMDSYEPYPKTSVGGLVGTNNGGTIQSCTFSGNIITNAYNIGGIAGLCMGTDPKVEDCVNSGILISKRESTSTVYGVGGIVGLLRTGTVSDCTNNGAVTGYIGNPVGGIIGNMWSGAISGCRNTGTVQGQGYSAYGIGGIVGEVAISNSANSVEIEGCHNSGDVTLSSGIQRQIGGIVGSASGSSGNIEISKCSNTGTISSAQSGNSLKLGGLVGSTSGVLTLTQSYNAGRVNIPSSTGYAGGLIGQAARPTSHQVENCYNVGSVTGGTAGGLIGSLYANSSSGRTVSISDSYNAGTVNNGTGNAIVGATSTFVTLTVADNCTYLDTSGTDGHGQSETANQMTDDASWATNLGLDISVWEKTNNPTPAGSDGKWIGNLPVLTSNKQNPAPQLERTQKQDQSGFEITGQPAGTIYVDNSGFDLYTTGGNGSGRVTWSSNNDSIATVDSNGNVTIIGVGDVTITATKAGDDTYNSASDGYSFTVYGKPITEVTILNLEAPVQGATPIQHVDVPEDAHYVVLTSAGIGGPSTLGVIWRELGTVEIVKTTFEQNKTYTVQMCLKCDEHYSFADEVTVSLFNMQESAYSSITVEKDPSFGDRLIITVTFNPTSHVHNWDTANWDSNETHHWHNCLDADCPLKNPEGMDGYAEHVDADNDDLCDVCGYDMYVPPVNIPDTYDIELIVGEGGEAKTNLSNASAGTTITVTATPDNGYELAYITVDGERIDGTTFKMPEHDVTVRVYFTNGGFPFTDVAPGAWYYDAVSYVYANGLMDGVSASEFNPDGSMTRAMVWAILARIDGETVTGASWIETARAWAMAEGVSDGTDANGLVTREQLATMLWRYAGEPDSDYSLSAFTDAASVSEWAETAMSWAVENGLITGVTANTLVPSGSATRAQCAAILMRYVENI